MKALVDFQTALSSAIRSLDRAQSMAESNASQERKHPTGELRQAEADLLLETMRDGVMFFATVADRIETLREIEKACDEAEKNFIE